MDSVKNTSADRTIPVPTADEDAPSPATPRRRPNPPLIKRAAGKRRFRLSFATLINLGALIVLFTVVFALQHLSSNLKGHKDAVTSTNPQATEGVSDDAPKDATTRVDTSREPAKNAVVDLPELKSMGAQNPASATPDKTRRTATQRQNARRSDIGWEDRNRSAALVDQLDGSYRYSSTTTHHATAPAPHSYPSYGSSYSSHAAYSTAATAYRSDLDDETARRHYLNTNQQPASNDTYSSNAATTPYPTPVAHAQPTEAALYDETILPSTETSRKPAWEVTVGQR